jgi:hypothetical protein
VFYCTTEEFNFSGNENGIKINLSCKKGWSIVYFGYDLDTFELLEATTQKPSGLIWIFIDNSSSAQTITSVSQYTADVLIGVLSSLKQSKAFSDTKEIDKLRSVISKKLQIGNN